MTDLLARMGRILRHPPLPLAIILAMLLACAAAFAADGDTSSPKAPGQVEAYFPDRQTAAYRAVANGSADAADETSWGNVPFFSVGGRVNISVSGRFSGSASDTATIWVARYHYDPVSATHHFIGASTATLTAGALTDANGDNVAPTVTFDSAGATHLKVVATAVSAGTCTLWVGSY